MLPALRRLSGMGALRFVGRKARTHTEIDDVLLELPSRIYFSNSLRAVPHVLVLIKVKSDVSKLLACLGLGNTIFLQGDARFLRRGVKALAHDTIRRASINYANKHSPSTSRSSTIVHTSSYTLPSP